MGRPSREPARATRDSLYGKISSNHAESNGASVIAGSVFTKRSKATRPNARKLSDADALRAANAIDAGSSLRAEAKALGVSHVSLFHRIKLLSERTNGYAPDELDKALIHAVLAAGIPGLLDRLSDIVGWTRVELLEVVR